MGKNTQELIKFTVDMSKTPLKGQDWFSLPVIKVAPNPVTSDKPDPPCECFTESSLSGQTTSVRVDGILLTGIAVVLALKLYRINIYKCSQRLYLMRLLKRIGMDSDGLET